jgi:putative transposase
MMDSLDPSKWDKIEGKEAKEKVIQDLKNRLSKFHEESEEFQNYVDNHLQDQKLEDFSRELDQAIIETIKVIEEEVDSTFTKTPKAPETTTKIQHEINFKPGEELPKSPPTFRLSKPTKELIESWIEWMLDRGLIRRSQAKSVQNLLVIFKPGKDPRVCFDARAVNKITIPDGYPPHRMDDLFAKLRDCVVFSSLDAASGFFQIPIKEEDRHKTAFRTESGVYEFCVMPFGLINAPATFTRWMTESFRGLRDIMQVYMDDMIIHSKVLSNHHIHLRSVFRRCQENGIRLRLSKCEFLKEELNLLG